MPPKLSKKEQEELARQEEEQRQREEEERLRREAEERKKYEPALLKSGLTCILTEYFVQEVVKSSDPRQFTQDFVENYIKRNNLTKNFRKIDIDLITDFHLYNINFACEKLFSEYEIYIFLNILWTVLRENDPKYTYKTEQGENEQQQDGPAPSFVELSEEEQQQQEKLNKQRKQVILDLGQKSQEKDLKLFQQLLVSHGATAKKDSENSIPVFNAKAMQIIILYFRKTYFAHYNLYRFVGQNDQQNIDIYEKVFVDQPQPIPEGFDDANYEPIYSKEELEAMQQEEKKKEEELLKQNEIQKIEEESKPEEEDPLDPVSQQILEEKVRQAREQMEKQLADRLAVQQAKIEELQATKGKKK